MELIQKHFSPSWFLVGFYHTINFSSKVKCFDFFPVCFFCNTFWVDLFCDNCVLYSSKVLFKVKYYRCLEMIYYCFVYRYFNSFNPNANVYTSSVFFFLVLIVNFNKTSLFKSVNLIWTQGSSVFKPPWWRASNNELNIFLNRSVWRHLLNSKCNNKFINIFFAWVPSSLNL